MGRIHENDPRTLTRDGKDDPNPDSWTTMVAEVWLKELADSAQDIYALDDGEPADELR